MNIRKWVSTFLKNLTKSDKKIIGVVCFVFMDRNKDEYQGNMYSIVYPKHKYTCNGILKSIVEERAAEDY